MELANFLEEKVKKLINLRMNKGITPVELMSNIYNEDYIEIKSKRQFDQVFCYVSFYDSDFFSDNKVKIEYKYTYDNENCLQQISSIKNKNEQIIWSRAEEENILLSQITTTLLKYENKEVINKFIKTLPNDLQEKICNLTVKVS
ncbi:hypothetical protein P4V47_06730 [Brevibacillus laterosporus]|uniref:hypothetical protein n=1 Tax=Brevibacillus laterosporus TaxID=1465 RepID=UPI0018CF0FBB|nr:hypothetical protein [Brevibacillus laterosporus]MBG9789221.1 hypothetical protein [Brevibacillus laterosporus]MED1787208.1 hypothetical protein [Brevibacillus laterosporus]